MTRNTGPVAPDGTDDISQLQTSWLGPLPALASATGPLADGTASARRAASNHEAGSPAVPAPLPAPDDLAGQYEAESQRWLALAFRLSEDIRLGAERLARTMARWRELIDLPTVRPEEDAELTAIEQELPELSAQIARNRQRWTTYLSWAHDLDNAAQRLRADAARRAR